MKVIICKGLPASGKTTWAKEQVEKSGKNIIRFNKDDLRAMLGGYSKDNEKLVLELRDTAIKNAIAKQRNIIIDDTNLDPKHEIRIRELCKGTGVTVVIQEFTTPVDECIKRDSLRQNPVGAEVIRDMDTRYKWIKPEFIPVVQNSSLPSAYISDIDGTVALMNGRSPYDYSKVSEDLPNYPVIHLLQSLSADNYFGYGSSKIIFVSGRPDSCREDTIKWLQKIFGIKYPKLYMRKTGDKRPDTIIKREILDELIKQYYIEGVFDDRKRVVDSWRQAGLTCFQVAEGNF